MWGTAALARDKGARRGSSLPVAKRGDAGRRGRVVPPPSGGRGPHVPVLLGAILEHCSPIAGHWIDGTLGAGGYARGLLEAGADRVTGVDRDPLAHEMAAEWGADFGDRIALFHGNFSDLDQAVDGLVDGVVLDLGVSSMQLDRAERGFSFLRDGPLDMRMGQDGVTAAELIAATSESDLADILYLFGEERASRRIARAVVAARKVAPIETTLALAEIVEACLPRAKPGQAHPATRTFQAIRIAVNDEFGSLLKGLEAAERALKPGGLLAVVTFHSLEDRIVKRFFQARSNRGGGGNRYAPEMAERHPGFSLVTRRAVPPDAVEIADNPRARSAKLRIGRREDGPAEPVDAKAMGVPMLGRGS